MKFAKSKNIQINKC